MTKDILNQYGSNSSQPQRSGASNGGQQSPKELPYSPPVGPTNINDAKTPGIHGTNHGNCVNQGRH